MLQTKIVFFYRNFLLTPPLTMNAFSSVHNISDLILLFFSMPDIFAILTRSLHKKSSFVWNKIRLQNNTDGFLICSVHILNIVAFKYV